MGKFLLLLLRFWSEITFYPGVNTFDDRHALTIHGRVGLVPKDCLLLEGFLGVSQETRVDVPGI